MMRAVLSIILIALCAVTFAQDHGESSPTLSSNRKELLRDLAAQNRGDITAIEPSSKDDGGVIVGYSSGVVAKCMSDQDCRVFDGTPNVSVEHIAVSKRGVYEIVWVTYRQGALYRCEDSSCVKFLR
jgi:hypothetical protein